MIRTAGWRYLAGHMGRQIFYIGGMLHEWVHQIPPARDCHGCDPICKLSQNSDVTRVVVNVVPTLHMLTGRQSPCLLEQLKTAAGCSNMFVYGHIYNTCSQRRACFTLSQCCIAYHRRQHADRRVFGVWTAYACNADTPTVLVMVYHCRGGCSSTPLRFP